MSVKRYKNIGVFPLEFQDKQQVETGEEFERDFEASVEGAQHERYLVATALICELPTVASFKPSSEE